eukprot:TRINITY_DN67023_c7_g2_i1.p1 TRINITY_DN67023_c7_g2~~TRINITY_DN67023_c7_g2_i1.p1  ORF type:complete len:943 (+),score=65.50 TRINITY_DN67023_c7_g2_i1:65-2893(+)
MYRKNNNRTALYRAQKKPPVHPPKPSRNGPASLLPSLGASGTPPQTANGSQARPFSGASSKSSKYKAPTRESSMYSGVAELPAVVTLSDILISLDGSPSSTVRPPTSTAKVNEIFEPILTASNKADFANYDEWLQLEENRQIEEMIAEENRKRAIARANKKSRTEKILAARAAAMSDEERQMQKWQQLYALSVKKNGEPSKFLDWRRAIAQRFEDKRRETHRDHPPIEIRPRGWTTWEGEDVKLGQEVVIFKSTQTLLDNIQQAGLHKNATKFQIDMDEQHEQDKKDDVDNYIDKKTREARIQLEKEEEAQRSRKTVGRAVRRVASPKDRKRVAGQFPDFMRAPDQAEGGTQLYKRSVTPKNSNKPEMRTWLQSSTTYLLDRHVAEVNQRREEMVNKELEELENRLELSDWKRYMADETRASRHAVLARKERAKKWLGVLSVIMPAFLFDIAAAMGILRKLFFPRYRFYFKFKRMKMARKFITSVRSRYIPQLNEEIFHKIDIFKRWPEANIQNLLPALFNKAFLRGEYIMKQGDSGSELYFLMTGEVEVIIHKPKKKGKGWSLLEGDTQTVATLKPGACFGEFAVLNKEPRMASIRCKTRCDVWVLTKQMFRAQLDKCPPDVLAETHHLANNRRATNLPKLYPLKPKHLLENEIFQKWDEKELNQLISAAKPAIFNQGDTIIKQGTMGHSLFLIVRGEVTVTTERKVNGKNEVTEVATLGHARMFGEISCLFLERRTATVKACGMCDCWEIHKDALMGVLTANPINFVAAKSITNKWRAKWMGELVKEIPLEVLENQLFFWPMIPKKHHGTIQALWKPMVKAHGDHLVEPGCPCDTAYITTLGEVEKHHSTTPVMYFSPSAIGSVEIFLDCTWAIPFRVLSTTMEGWWVQRPVLLKALRKLGDNVWHTIVKEARQRGLTDDIQDNVVEKVERTQAGKGKQK